MKNWLSFSPPLKIVCSTFHVWQAMWNFKFEPLVEIGAFHRMFCKPFMCDSLMGMSLVSNDNSKRHESGHWLQKPSNNLRRSTLHQSLPQPIEFSTEPIIISLYSVADTHRGTELAHRRGKANMTGIATKFVSLILISYFVYHIVRAVEKLYENKIGTSVTRKNAHIIPYPSMTFCPFNNR